jgi:hypothetical protein
MISKNMMKLNVLGVLVVLAGVSSANAMDMTGKKLQRKMKQTNKKVQKEENERSAKQNRKEELARKRELDTALAASAAKSKQTELAVKFKVMDDADRQTFPYVKERKSIEPEKTIAQKNKESRERDLIRKARKEQAEKKSFQAPDFTISITETPEIIEAPVTLLEKIEPKAKKKITKLDPDADYNPNGKQPGKDWTPNLSTN